MDANSVSPALLRPASMFPAPGEDMSEAAMRKVATDFEASYLSQMLKPMFEGLKSDGPFGGGAGEEMWRGFLVEEMGKQTARAGGVGLADTVLSHMLKAQEGLV
ncbi:rod-binding protein [Brevundimonas sp. GN22]